MLGVSPTDFNPPKPADTDARTPGSPAYARRAEWPENRGMLPGRLSTGASLLAANGHFGLKSLETGQKLEDSPFRDIE